MENNYKYIVYKTTNKVNGKIYIGVHKTFDANIFDGYIGCGINIYKISNDFKPITPFQRAVKKYGVNAFEREILYIYDNPKEASDKEKEIVNGEFLLRQDTYNIAFGGYSFAAVRKDQPVYQFDLNGQCIHIWNDIYEIVNTLNLKIYSIESAIKRRGIVLDSYWSINEVIDISTYTKPKERKQVYKYDINGKLLETYESLYIAAKCNDYKTDTLLNRIREKACTKNNYYSYELYQKFPIKKRLQTLNQLIHIYNIDGSYDRSLYSKEAKEYLGIDQKKKLGYFIRRLTPINNKFLRIEKTDFIVPVFPKIHPKPVMLYDLANNFIKEYNSIGSLSKEMNLQESEIRRVLNGVLNQTKGYIIRYKYN